MSGVLEVRHLFPGVAKLIIRKSVQNFHEFQSLLKISGAVWPKKSSRLFSRSDGKIQFSKSCRSSLSGSGIQGALLREPSREKAKRYRDGVIANADS